MKDAHLHPTPSRRPAEGDSSRGDTATSTATSSAAPRKHARKPSAAADAWCGGSSKPETPGFGGFKFGCSVKEEKRRHRLWATRKELLSLKFEGDMQTDEQRDEARARSRKLIPEPPRACSRQTGAIVFRGYDRGHNPFAPVDDRPVGKASESMRLTDDDIRQAIEELAASSVRRRGTLVSPTTGQEEGGSGVFPLQQPDSADGVSPAAVAATEASPVKGGRRQSTATHVDGPARGAHRNVKLPTIAVKPVTVTTPSTSRRASRPMEALPPIAAATAAAAGLTAAAKPTGAAPAATSDGPTSSSVGGAVYSLRDDQGLFDDAAGPHPVSPRRDLQPNRGLLSTEAAFGDMMMVESIAGFATPPESSPHIQSPGSAPRTATSDRGRPRTQDTTAERDGKDDEDDDLPTVPQPASDADMASASPLLAALAKSKRGKVAFFGAPADDDTANSMVKAASNPKLPVAFQRQNTVYRIAERTAREEQEARNPTSKHTPSRVLEQQRIERRKTMLMKHSVLLRHNNVVEGSKVEQLVRAVMALNALDLEALKAYQNASQPHARGGTDGQLRENGAGGANTARAGRKQATRGYMQATGRARHAVRSEREAEAAAQQTLSSGHRVTTDDEKYNFSVENVKALHETFERLVLEHAFMGCISTGQPMIVGDHVVSKDQLLKCTNVDMEVQFEPLLRHLRPDVPEAHVTTVIDKWRSWREELLKSNVGFRERLDLATVKDIEHVWERVLSTFATSDPNEILVACEPPHDRGITLTEYTSYVTHMNSALPPEEAHRTFKLHCVPGGLARLLGEGAPTAANATTDDSPGSPRPTENGSPKSLARQQSGRSRSRSIAFTRDGDGGESSSQAPDHLERSASFAGLKRTASVASSRSDEPTPQAPSGNTTSKDGNTPSSPKLTRDRSASIAKTVRHGLTLTRSRSIRGKKDALERSLSKARATREAIARPTVLPVVEQIMTIEGFAATVAPEGSQ